MFDFLKDNLVMISQLKFFFKLKGVGKMNGRNDGFRFKCPKCQKSIEASWANMGREYGNAALCIPYFMCGGCRLACVDQALVKKVIRDYIKFNKSLQIIVFSQIYNRAMEYMKKDLKPLYEKVGYRFVRFQKAPNPRQ